MSRCRWARPGAASPIRCGGPHSFAGNHTATRVVRGCTATPTRGFVHARKDDQLTTPSPASPRGFCRRNGDRSDQCRRLRRILLPDRPCRPDRGTHRLHGERRRHDHITDRNPLRGQRRRLLVDPADPGGDRGGRPRSARRRLRRLPRTSRSHRCPDHRSARTRVRPDRHGGGRHGLGRRRRRRRSVRQRRGRPVRVRRDRVERPCRVDRLAPPEQLPGRSPDGAADRRLRAGGIRFHRDAAARR